MNTVPCPCHRGTGVLQWPSLPVHNTLSVCGRCQCSDTLTERSRVTVGKTACCIDAIERVCLTYISRNESVAGHSVYHCYRTRVLLRPVRGGTGVHPLHFFVVGCLVYVFSTNDSCVDHGGRCAFVRCLPSLPRKHGARGGYSRTYGRGVPRPFRKRQPYGRVVIGRKRTFDRSMHVPPRQLGLLDTDCGMRARSLGQAVQREVA